jgi:hypothetical protein
MKTTSKSWRSIIWIWLIVFNFALLFILIWQPMLAQADSGLPSRPNPPQPVSPQQPDDKEPEKPLGAYIELQVTNAPANAWTAVQWQDSAGGWQNVEGWQGTLEARQEKLWWVAAKDFSTGPFRWVILDQSNGSLVAVSEPFLLPTGADQMVQITVAVK